MRALKTRLAFGFTMVELMVALAVMMILMLAAAPSFADFIDRYRLRGAVDDVLSTISNARAESVKVGRDVRIDFAGTSTAWCMAANPAAGPSGGNEIGSPADCDCAAGTCSAMPDGQPLQVAIGEHGGVSASAGTIAKAFVFDSKLGLIDPIANHSLTFSSPSGKYSMSVEIAALGQASACVPAGEPAMSGVPQC